MSNPTRAAGDATQELDFGRLESLLLAVRSLPTDERAAYLDASCTDPLMRDELEMMLATDPTDAPRSPQCSDHATSPFQSGTVGQRIGPWRLDRLLGEGGMGSVYLARRVDGEFEQQVALKLLRSVLPSDRLLERFRHERQILANLRHPNIAALLDGGATETGLPYLVMELIRGEPMDRYCELHQLPVRERLRLIQKVCAAVQSAHQNLVIHRDIKPANILVDDQGEPKLLDFGIAKLLDDEAEIPETRFGERLLTPEFAAPEQVRGEAITTATDVYTLGVLLYLILTGRSPYRRWISQPLELQQAICMADPPPPSLALEAGESVVQTAAPRMALKRELRGDLDHVVLKAMRKEPGQRYASPAALAEDLQRYLDREPIQARQGSWRYRSGKFLRRNALAVTAAAFIILAIATLTTFYTTRLQTERDAAQAARQLAERERSAAQTTADFLAGLFRAASPQESRPDLLARDLLMSASKRIETELSGQPQVEARLQNAIGQAFWSLGLHEEGESRIRRALALMRQAAPDDPRGGDMLAQFGRELVEHERYDEGLAVLNEAETLLRRVLGSDHTALAAIMQHIDRVASNRHHDTSDERGLRLDEIERIFRVNGQEMSRDYALLLAARSAWHKQRFEWSQSMDAVSQAIAIQTAALGRRHPSVVFTIEDQARLLYFRGDYLAAAPLFAEVVSIIEEFKGSEHSDMAWSLYYQARIARETGDHPRAGQLVRKLVQIETITPFTADLRYLARALCAQALVQADAGEHEAAHASSERAREILIKTRQQRIQMDVVHEAAGIAALARGDIETALREMRALTAVRRAEIDPAQTDTPLAIGLEASAEATAGKHERALALFAEALELTRSRYDINYPSRGRILWARAGLHASRGDAAAAAADRVEARRILAIQGLPAQSAAWTLPSDGAL